MHAALLTEPCGYIILLKLKVCALLYIGQKNLKSGLTNSLVYRNVLWSQCGVATHSFQRIYEGCKFSEEGRCLECLLADRQAHSSHYFLLLLTVKRTGWYIEMLPASYQGFLCGVFSAAVAQRQSVLTLKLSTIAEFRKSSHEWLEL